MRIMFLVDSLNAGGAGRVVSELASYLSEHGESVLVTTMSVNEVSYPLNSMVKHIPLMNLQQKNQMNVFQRAIALRRLCESEKIEILISFLTEVNIYASMANVFSNYKTIVCERGDPRYNPPLKKLRIARDLLYNCADGFVYQSESARNYFVGKARKKGLVIANPLSSCVPEPYRGSKEKRIVSVGRLQRVKNYHMAIDAFSLISNDFPEYTYEIYGEGPCFDELEKLIEEKKLKDKVVLKGQTNNIYDEIKTASLFILSSDHEGMPNALIEAMALGIPAISTDFPSGTARTIIDDGKSGFLVPVNDRYMLAEKIKVLLSDEMLIIRFSEQATSIRDRFDLDAICKQWIDYIKTVCN